MRGKAGEFTHSGGHAGVNVCKKMRQTGAAPALRRGWLFQMINRKISSYFWFPLTSKSRVEPIGFQFKRIRPPGRLSFRRFSTSNKHMMPLKKCLLSWQIAKTRLRHGESGCTKFGVLLVHLKSTVRRSNQKNTNNKNKTNTGAHPPHTHTHTSVFMATSQLV